MQYQNLSDDEMLDRAITDLLQSREIVILEQSRRGINKPVILVAGQTLRADYFEKGSSPEALNMVNAHVVNQCIDELLAAGKIAVCGYDEDGERLFSTVEPTLH
ncbi:hypothetical protein [Paraburkholderia graminis]